MYAKKLVTCSLILIYVSSLCKKTPNTALSLFLNRATSIFLTRGQTIILTENYLYVADIIGELHLTIKKTNTNR